MSTIPIIASLPILIILVLMIGFRWGAARAGAAGYLTAFLIAIIFFGAGADVLAFAHVKRSGMYLESPARETTWRVQNNNK